MPAIQNSGSPTVREVARLAGVSTATVSRVANRPEKVSIDTIRTVREAAAQLGFRASESAKEVASVMD
jgi:DNA-binding LacI/PurR family transcriptional regulator